MGEKRAFTNRQRSHTSTVENVKAYISIRVKTKTKYKSIYWLVIANYNIKSYIIRIAEYIFLNCKLTFGLKVFD